MIVRKPTLVAMLTVAIVATSCRTRSTADHAATPPQVVALCDLIENSASYDGRVVDVAAFVSPTSHYGMMLIDPACASRAIALAIPSEIESAPAVEDLRVRVFAGFPRQRAKVPVRLVGEYREQQDPPRRVIWLRTVHLE